MNRGHWSKSKREQKSTREHKREQKSTKEHKRAQKSTKEHKREQKRTKENKREQKRTREVSVGETVQSPVCTSTCTSAPLHLYVFELLTNVQPVCPHRHVVMKDVPHRGLFVVFLPQPCPPVHSFHASPDFGILQQQFSSVRLFFAGPKPKTIHVHRWHDVLLGLQRLDFKRSTGTVV